ncbi:DUF6691 family protein [Dechloromonas sp. HYN0024]|uniref:DUF6691 family protein n=1 Tax=Dechloromonas sp. HYN0024 TaxID=2231055 RepID=UPI00196878ED|nr:DUF6691 family protein [Dechloromonas sp. HYN0024]
MSQRLSALEPLATLASGMLFGFGLAWSTMIRPESVLAFLTFDDLGLLFVLGSAVGINLLVYQLLPRLCRHTLLGAVFQQRPFEMDGSALLGGILFGIGWGICGVCPGPALAGLGAGNIDLLMALAAIFVGALLHGLWVDARNPARDD